ncbi:hypothetical protein QJS10_CPA01g00916 [Acorus calamus]|uniref:Uncharacterized protein n=1 Tax=Acorus calamus TaxID=4465 RepID=A0AAV9FL24_ACOCL|nr:hypothetical protein QJS10_CPA01g00916 [Acorus calamus]
MIPQTPQVSPTPLSLPSHSPTEQKKTPKNTSRVDWIDLVFSAGHPDHIKSTDHFRYTHRSLLISSLIFY